MRAKCYCGICPQVYMCVCVYLDTNTTGYYMKVQFGNYAVLSQIWLIYIFCVCQFWGHMKCAFANVNAFCRSEFTHSPHNIRNLDITRHLVIPHICLFCTSTPFEACKFYTILFKSF